MLFCKKAVCLLFAAVMAAGAGSVPTAAAGSFPVTACADSDTFEDDEGFVYRVKDDGSCILMRYRGDCWDITIPDKIEGHTVTEIDAGCFSNKGGFRYLSIPASVKELPDRWAYGCRGLEKVTFRNGVERIGKESFFGCPKLAKVILPPSVKAIDGELTDDAEIKKYSNFYFYRGTYAHEYLKEHRYHRITFPLRVGEFDVVYCKKSAAKLKWTSVSTASGYQIQLSPDSRFKKNVRTVTVKGRKITSCVIKNIKADPTNKRCNFRIRTYRNVGGKKYFGAFVGTISARVK